MDALRFPERGHRGDGEDYVGTRKKNNKMNQLGESKESSEISF